MLKRKTIASYISNLSDARYFAAYDVDIMAFLVSPEGDNLGQIREMIEWIEGPKVYLQFEEWDANLVSFAMQQCKAEGVLIPFSSKTKAQNHYDLMFLHANIAEYGSVNESEEDQHIFEIKSGSELPAKESTTAYFLPGEISSEEIAQVLEKYQQCGIALVGGTEEKVGYKSFEEQDEIIEQLIED